MLISVSSVTAGTVGAGVFTASTGVAVGAGSLASVDSGEGESEGSVGGVVEGADAGA